jgi:hypothetical protein
MASLEIGMGATIISAFRFSSLALVSFTRAGRVWTPPTGCTGRRAPACLQGSPPVLSRCAISCFCPGWTRAPARTCRHEPSLRSPHTTTSRRFRAHICVQPFDTPPRCASMMHVNTINAPNFLIHAGLERSRRKQILNPQGSPGHRSSEL